MADSAPVPSSSVSSPKDAPQGAPDLDDLRESLLAAVRDRAPRVDRGPVREAYELARLAHADQRRSSGDPYLTHTISTLDILLDLLESRLDTAVACAALLHDTVEDTTVTLEEIRTRFGEEVATLVDGVTKISGFHFDSPKAEQAENFRKMLLSMARDLRVIFIKLADRMHNMRTIEYLPRERALRIARETRDIYAPLAHRLGIGRVKREMEDRALAVLDPEGYAEVAEKVAQQREEREAFLGRLIRAFAARLDEEGVAADIQARPKHLYSIYLKMKHKGRPFEQIYDLYGLRVLAANEGDCYRVLGVVHDLWTPVQDRLKDYIATPKSNLYQSLHTTVVVPGHEMVEIQIRTREMHRTAESGVAAHYVYKEGGRVDEELDARLGGFVSQTADWQSTASDDEYLEFLRTALYQDEVFVFTPRGELKRLPRGSTPLDFAFHVHSEVGFHCAGARVNGTLVPLRHELHNGDTIEVITSASARPHQDWLSIARSTSARSKIRHWLREQHRTDAIALGREMIERELKKRNAAELRTFDLAAIAKSLDVADEEALLARVGQGTLALGQVVRRLLPEEGIAERLRRGTLEAFRQVTKRQEPGRGVRIDGLDNVLLNFAGCCQPVPGDAVIGWITRGRGVSVHRVECPNTLDDPERRERLVEVEWNVSPQQLFPVRLLIYGTDRPSLLADIAKAIAALRVNIRSAGMAGEDRMARGAFLVEVQNLKSLQDVIQAVRKVKGVSRVERQAPTKDGGTARRRA